MFTGGPRQSHGMLALEPIRRVSPDDEHQSDREHNSILGKVLAQLSIELVHQVHGFPHAIPTSPLARVRS
jgi:hypothetical protein